MLRRLKPAFAAGMLILYAGMMLGGQSLHQLLGCEDEHAFVPAHAVAEATDSAIVQVEATVEHSHDADACPICQFQAHGQIAAQVVGSELTQTVVAVAPLCSSPTVAVFALGVQGPRPPPCV